MISICSSVIDYHNVYCTLRCMKRAPEELRFAAMAVDAVVFSIIEGKLVTLVGSVSSTSAYRGQEAFIGGLIKESENADQALARILKEKAAVTPVYSEQLYTFSAVNRDKRNRVVSVAYIAFVRPTNAEWYKHDNAHFVPVQELKKLGYDHDDILIAAIARLKGKLTYTSIAQFLLPTQFTLTELQNVYEIILNREIDKRNFRKKIIALDIVRDIGRVQEGVQNRPAALYEFISPKLIELPILV